MLACNSRCRHLLAERFFTEGVSCRHRRLEELRKATKAADRFGSVRDIGRADYVREVTNAGPDVWVAVHLHQPA